MNLHNDFQRFLIISETDTREPLCILLRLLDELSEDKIQCFFKTLVSLVEEEMLFCYFWSTKEKQYIITKANLTEHLNSYVEERCDNKQSLIETCAKGPTLEFMHTEKGNIWLMKKYVRVESKGIEFVNLLERYKIENDKYPKSLCALCPTYINATEQPSEIYGSWWYMTDESRDTFLFGYFSFFGLLKVFNTSTQQWYELNS